MSRGCTTLYCAINPIYKCPPPNIFSLKRVGIVVPDGRVAIIMTDGYEICLRVSCTLETVSKSNAGSGSSNISC